MIGMGLYRFLDLESVLYILRLVLKVIGLKELSASCFEGKERPNIKELSMLESESVGDRNPLLHVNSFWSKVTQNTQLVYSPLFKFFLLLTENHRLV